MDSFCFYIFALINEGMEIVFSKKYLEDLYEKGRCDDKKHRFQLEVISKYRKTIDLIESCSVKEDLFRFRSLNFEALSGSKNGMFSVRVNLQYRIEFSLEEMQNGICLTICSILEMSNHYK